MQRKYKTNQITTAIITEWKSPDICGITFPNSGTIRMDCVCAKFGKFEKKMFAWIETKMKESRTVGFGKQPTISLQK